MNTVVFDLDGTISSPAKGITRSINYALVELGYPALLEKDLESYIGPHLHVIFSTLMKTADGRVLDQAVALYRQRYLAIGYQENHLYAGIAELLQQLTDSGNTLCIATAKRRDIAIKVLEYLSIVDLFARIHGCGTHQPKSELLRALVSDRDVGAHPMVMIGDRSSDFRAASEVGMPSIAVKWGFGSEDEYAEATDIVERPAQLSAAIARTAQLV